MSKAIPCPGELSRLVAAMIFKATIFKTALNDSGCFLWYYHEKLHDMER